MTRIPLLLVMLVSLCMFQGCSRSSAPEKKSGADKGSSTAALPAGNQEEAVKGIINRYNVLLTEGYRALNMNGLAEVTTVSLAEKAFHHMAAIGEGGTRMLPVLKKTDFLAVRFPQPGLAEVRTREVWDYDYVDVKTGKLQERTTDYVYEVNYRLAWLKEGKWQLAEIAAEGKSPDTWKK